MMQYVQVNRTIEAHSECILFLYLSDANGAPVPDVKMKIWAGPPPTGQPPYYEDEEPDNPNRRTDSNGKFQFIVASSAPTQPLDFFVQAVGLGDIPQSEPVHFPFPPHETRRVIVTMAPESATAVQGRTSAALADLQLDRGLQMKVGMATPPGSDAVNAGTAFAGTNKVTLEHPLPTKPQPRSKPFTHYLLFGPGSLTGTLTNLIIALDYIVRYAPVVGFSPDEAKYAEHVTLVGDATALSSALEQSLREAGCIVARLTASDSYALETVFKQLIDSGSPFPTQ
jgi:hypothetical protein